ncbi:MAG TPA: hypothetical protein VMX14_07500 [Anaerolineae bacterium]|nr:hypothetical protein [Anaerolineae bacterium]
MARAGSQRTVPGFLRWYEPHGLTPDKRIAFGVMERTLTQVSRAGWKLLESFDRAWALIRQSGRMVEDRYIPGQELWR